MLRIFGDLDLIIELSFIMLNQDWYYIPTHFDQGVIGGMVVIPEKGIQSKFHYNENCFYRTIIENELKSRLREGLKFHFKELLTMKVKMLWQN